MVVGQDAAHPQLQTRVDAMPLLLLALLLAPLFLAAWQLEPLYAGNQNTKYLHALARLGIGYLNEDWLSHTKDGLPLFTGLLELIYKNIGAIGYYIGTVVTHFGFMLCALVIYDRVTRPHTLPLQARMVFLAILFVLAAIQDIGQNFYQGFAEQYILGGYFQTADFGVLLLGAVLLFEAGHLAIACICILIGAAVHPGYVVPGAVLTAAFLIFELAHWRSGTATAKLRSVLICAIGLAALAAISIALNRLFTPTDPQLQHEAHRVLTEVRIPRHASPAAWFNVNVVLQFAILIATALMLPPGRFRFVLRVGLVALTLFTIGAFFPHTETYRLVAPWRVSVVLLPLSSLALFALLMIRLDRGGAFSKARQPRIYRGSLAVIALSIAGGIAFSIAKFLAPDPAYTEFVRSHLAAGQHYLTPPGRVDFRLETGAPQYVTFKSHPYQDVEVLEWNRRLDVAKDFYRQERADCIALAKTAAADRITHVIIESGRPALDCAFASNVFEKSGIRIFKLDIAADRPH